MTKLKNIKLVDSDTLLKKQLKNKSFRKEYELLKKEFKIAKQIIELRKKAKMTQKQLADKAGTSQPAIARLESGEYTNLSLTFLNKIGKALKVVPEVQFKKIKHAN